jgi:uncharacterized protein (DUF1697 family)
MTVMARYAALLRGINVGGNKKIAMSELRDLLANLGYADVTTYLQSGNAVFTSPGQPAALGLAIEERIAAEFGKDVRVLIRTATELADVLGRSPLPGQPENPSRFFVAFLAAAPDPDLVAEIEVQSFGQDQIWISGREAYLWCPGGAADTPLTHNFVEKRLRVTATARNWNTVTKLVNLTSA